MIINSYSILKEKHQREVNEFPLFFAFNDEQFSIGMIKLGLKPTDTDKICKLGHGTWGFCKKTDTKFLTDMFTRHKEEIKESIASDITGDGFIYDMFNYELANYEYGYTGDAEDTLNALGYTYDDIENNPILKYGFNKACKYQMER